MPFSNMVAAINAYISAKPWERASKGGALIFGVDGKQGRMEYAVVTGRENGYTLALCRNEQALASYAALLKVRNEGGDELEEIGLQLDQDCLECRILPEQGEPLDRWLKVFGVEFMEWPTSMPKAVCSQPGRIPRLTEDEEQQELSRALFAAADYVKNPEAGKAASAAQMDGGRVPCARPDGEGGFRWDTVNIAGNMSLQFPSPALEDELAARRLRRLPVSGAEVRCAVRRLPMPMDEEVERVPTVMILLDDRLGVVAAPMVEDYEKEYGSFASEYIAYVEENGRPKRILAADPRTYCLLSELAGQMSTPIQRAGSMPQINDAVNGLMEYLKDQVGQKQGAEIDESDLSEKTTDVPGIGCVFYGQFEGTMEEVREYILNKFNQEEPDQDERLLVRITYPEDKAFWLYAAVKKDATLRHIDKFIRDEWVECCGHSSIFTIDGVQYTSNTRILPGRSMNAKAAEVMKPGVPVDYEYDIGTPTDLKVEIVGLMKISARREKILYMAQNYMPAYKCVRCGRRAELVSRPDMGPIKENVICARCSRKETEIGAYLPLLNSPRTGVCGYGLWYGGEDDE